MTIELNQDALTHTYKTQSLCNKPQLIQLISTYLEAVEAQKTEAAKPRPFDPSAVKPGDEVIVRDGSYPPYKFVGMKQDGDVVVENRQGYVYAFCHDDVLHLPIKPKTISINGHKVPEPMRDAPAVGSSYYLVNITDANLPSPATWTNHEADHFWLTRGLIHDTQKAAAAHGRALCSFTSKE